MLIDRQAVIKVPQVLLLALVTPWGGHYFYTHFTDGKSKVHRSWVTSPAKSKRARIPARHLPPKFVLETTSSSLSNQRHSHFIVSLKVCGLDI